MAYPEPQTDCGHDSTWIATQPESLRVCVVSLCLHMRTTCGHNKMTGPSYFTAINCGDSTYTQRPSGGRLKSMTSYPVDETNSNMLHRCLTILLNIMAFSGSPVCGTNPYQVLQTLIMHFLSHVAPLCR